MKIKFSIGVLLFIASLAHAATNDLTAALQRGLFEEEGNRDYAAAISAYQSLAAQFDQSRQVAATAIFRLGECYRKLGRTNDAAAQYDRIVREFSDQQTLATLSRQNITGLGIRTELPASTARLEQKDLLAKQIALAEQDLAEVKKKFELGAGATTQADIRAAEREVLRLRQQLAALDSKKDLLLELGPATSTEEDQEIRRLQAMIQNSPDLINALNGGSGGEMRTPLGHAAARDQLRVARFLLDHGADANRRSEYGGTPLNAAAESGHKAMVELLLNAGADINAKRGEYQNYTGPKPLTALDCAANRNFPAVVETLLAHKADPNIRGGDGMTPLHRAAKQASQRIAELLLKSGAGVNSKDYDDQTPLHVAAQGGNLEIISLLLANKAEVNARTKPGGTPLHLAAAGNKAEVLKLLLANGAEVNARDSSGETPLATAARTGSADAVNTLLTEKADPNLAATSGGYRSWTSLHHAVTGGRAEIVEALLEHGANPNVLIAAKATSAGSTPLNMTLDKSPELVNILLKHKANPNLPNADGARPLLRALEQQREPEMIKALLDSGADVNAPITSNGWLPLQLAVATGNKTLVETVLAYHPNVNAIGFNNETALDKTRGNSNTATLEIAALLRKHGALDDLPHRDRIIVSRPSVNFSDVVYLKGTNDWNRFSLLEAIAAHYKFIFATAWRDPNSSMLRFPDFKHTIIHRPAADGKSWKTIPVDVAEIFTSGDCSRDVWLEWGDIVEIPETDHPINQAWNGLETQDATALIKCVSRKVSVVVQGASKEINPPLQSMPMPGQQIRANVSRSFLVRPVLDYSNLIRFSSDLTRVKVTRRDAATGKTREWILDCSGQNSPDLWLRDGDVIEVPDK